MRVPRNAWACQFPTLNSLRRHFRKAVHTAYSFCRPPSSMTSITHRAVMHLHTPDYLWVHAGAQRACGIQPAESDTLTPSAVTVTCELISSLRTQRTFRPSANVNKRPYRWLIIARSAARLRGAYTLALRSLEPPIAARKGQNKITLRILRIRLSETVVGQMPFGHDYAK